MSQDVVSLLQQLVRIPSVNPDNAPGTEQIGEETIAVFLSGWLESIGAEVVLESAMGGAGWTLPPMLGSTAITALRIPVGAWAAAQFGTTGLWWTLALTAAARGVLMAMLWASGRWRRVVV